MAERQVRKSYTIITYWCEQTLLVYHNSYLPTKNQKDVHEYENRKHILLTNVIDPIHYGAILVFWQKMPVFLGKYH